MAACQYEHLRHLWVEWPTADQRLWKTALQPKLYAFEKGGDFAHLLERSAELYAYHASQARRWAIDQGCPADARHADIWTPERVRTYAQCLHEAGHSDTTIRAHLTAIERVMAAVAPHVLRRFFLDEISHWSRVSDEEKKLRRMQSQRDIDICAHALTTAWHQDPDRFSANISQRTGLHIGTLNRRAYRLEAFSLIEWWEEPPPISLTSLYLIKERKTWWIRCNEDQAVKRKKKPDDQPFPKQYVQALETYLSSGGPREYFCNRSGYQGRRLWVSDDGPLSGNGIYKQVMRKTADFFGVGINPHLFRSILATSLGNSGVAKRFSAHSLLANTADVTARSYDHSNPTAAACLAVAKLTDEFCRTGKMGSIQDIVEK